jgi:lipoate-protein ligase A
MTIMDFPKSLHMQKAPDKMIKSAYERVTCVGTHCNRGKMEIYEAPVNAFAEGKDYESVIWSMDEFVRTKELAEQKYRSDAWIYLR